MTSSMGHCIHGQTQIGPLLVDLTEKTFLLARKLFLSIDTSVLFTNILLYQDPEIWCVNNEFKVRKKNETNIQPHKY